MRTHQASSSLSVSSMTPRWMRFVLFPREWVPFCFRLADITGLTEGSKLPTCRETYWAAKYNEWHGLTWPCIDYGSACLPLHWSRQHGKWAGTCNRYNIDAEQPAISGVNGETNRLIGTNWQPCPNDWRPPQAFRPVHWVFDWSEHLQNRGSSIEERM